MSQNVIGDTTKLAGLMSEGRTAIRAACDGAMVDRPSVSDPAILPILAFAGADFDLASMEESLVITIAIGDDAWPGMNAAPNAAAFLQPRLAN